MKRFAALVLIACSCFLISIESPKAEDRLPWQHMAEEFLIDATARTGQGDTNVAVTFGWGHYVTDRTEVGAVLNALFDSGDGGYGAGPLYRFSFLPVACDAGGVCKGSLLLSASASVLTGDLSDQAAMAAATGIGYRHYLSQGSALNVLLNASRAINAGDAVEGGQNPLDAYYLTIGLSFGVPQAPAATP